MDLTKIDMGCEATRKKKVKQFSIDYLLNFQSSPRDDIKNNHENERIKIQKPIPEYVQPFPVRTLSEDLSRPTFVTTSPRERYMEKEEAPSPTNILNPRKRGRLETIGELIFLNNKIYSPVFPCHDINFLT